MSFRKLVRFSLANEWRNLSLLGVTFSTVLYRVSFTVADPDLWGHVKFGQDIWASGRVIQSDPYSYLTEGQRWINHEWLSELIFYGFYSTFGVIGLVGLKVCVSLAALAVVYQCLHQSGLSRVRACILTIWVAVLLVPGVSSVRPQLFSYVLFLLLLLILRKQSRAPTGWFWTVPLIFVVWVNLHGGFLAGLAVLLFWLAIRLLSALRAGDTGRALKRQLSGGPVLLLTLLALLVNPYGWRLLHFLVRPETLVRPEVTEWASLPMLSTYGGYLVALGVFSGASVWFSGRQRDPALIAVLGAIGLAAVMAFRHAPLLALAIPILAGEHIAEVWSRWMPVQVQKENQFKMGFILCWGTAYTLIMLTGSVSHFRCIRLDPASTGDYPVHAVALLEESKASGNMAVFFNWGEYALWHLGPRIKVSVDGRRETVYSDSVYQENLSFAVGEKGWNDILHKYETDLALVSRNYPVFLLMKNEPGWVTIYEDALCGLFARKGYSFLERLLKLRSRSISANIESRCFP